MIEFNSENKFKEEIIMKYCTKCGNELADEAVFCGKCGASFTNQPVQQQPFQPSITPMNTKVDKAGVGFIILSILIPIAGIILWAVKRKETPQAAKVYLICGIVAWAVSFLLTMLV